MSRESSLQKAALDRLNALPRCKAVNFHGSPFAERGTPDIVGTYNGLAFVVEMKRPGEVPEPLQLHRLREWRAAGARAGIATSPEQAVRIAVGAEAQRLKAGDVYDD